MTRSETLLRHFDEQAAGCEHFGSPFTAALIGAMRGDLEAGGPVAALVGDWPGSPRPDAVSLRLTGALHFAALSKMDPALAEVYPGGAKYSREPAWPRARDFLAREHDFVAGFVKSPPQTNETRRAIALLPGFLAAARRFGLPLQTFEIGASAGLNLNWDSFAYKTQSWSYGAGSVVIDTDWRGPAPDLSAPLRVAARAACDLNPLDIREPLARLRLKSYIWADQAERLARFDAAVALALAKDVRVERESAEVGLRRVLADRLPGTTAVVYHSIFYQYPPPPVRQAIAAAIADAGSRASASAPLAWLRFEPEALLGGPRDSMRFLVDLTTWPGGETRILALSDPHGRWVENTAA